MAILETYDLSKRFGRMWAVKKVNLSVEPGEIFGFLGPNGAGKSTTINMLTTLLKPTGGQALIAGHDVVAEPEKVRQNIGLVFQDPSLDETLTARENLYFHALLYGIPAKSREQKITMFLQAMELEHRKNSLVKTFSGGMRRRLEIARGLLHDPRVLFLDEPTLGLDPQTRRLIWKYVIDLRNRLETTIFLTTHYLEEAEHCDRIAIIDRGEIIAMDTPANLKSRLGGDIISMDTADNAAAAAFIENTWGHAVTSQQTGLSFKVANGEQFIPVLVKSLNIPIKTISVRKPTLEDVFVSLTGRNIREEVMDEKERMRLRVRVRRTR